MHEENSEVGVVRRKSGYHAIMKTKRGHHGQHFERYREAMQTLTENYKQEITSNHEKNAFNSVIESGSQIVVVQE